MAPRDCHCGAAVCGRRDAHGWRFAAVPVLAERQLVTFVHAAESALLPFMVDDLYCNEVLDSFSMLYGVISTTFCATWCDCAALEEVRRLQEPPTLAALRRACVCGAWFDGVTRNGVQLRLLRPKGVEFIQEFARAICRVLYALRLPRRAQRAAARALHMAASYASNMQQRLCCVCDASLCMQPHADGCVDGCVDSRVAVSAPRCSAAV